ncbi:HNH endonuclease [Alkalihalobacillus pseudalcaliphilus]|uniref:HNH endonuclease n=1 Tax=Alkalihalobacillus pseudalcaliphilus TaxID=79884 RepID=UPI002362EAC0|nr:HNH endonuclease [Alkalihalobacillus pseudalcaliphilus]
MERVYCSKTCANLGWKHLSIRRGIGKKYYGSNWLEQRRRCRDRDNYRCVDCGITENEYEKEMSVHHVIPFVYFSDYKEANKLSNLVSVCEDCHRVRHSGEGHPSKFNVNKIVTHYTPTVKMQQKEKAQEVYSLLINTDKTLAEISRETGMSYSGVRRIYCGKRWKTLYKVPANITNRRRCLRD